jgi:hypothetical protein
MMKTRLVFEITSDFSKKTDDWDDITEWLENKFHNSIHDVFEDVMTGDDFQQMVIDKMSEEPHMAEIKEFNDLGDILISLSDVDTITPFIPPPEKELPESQRTITEFA